MKNQVIDIFKEAEGKRFTYLVLNLSNRMSIQTCIERLVINETTDKVIFIEGKTLEWGENATISLMGIEEVEEIETDEYDKDYQILYQDGSILSIQIVYEYISDIE